MQERVVGFDARMDKTAVPAFWDAACCAAFLLRPDTGTPLSVDPIAWPSVFDAGQGIGLPRAERARLGFAGDGWQNPLPAWTGPHAPLWEDLAALQAHLRRGEDGRASWRLIAVTLCSDLDQPVAGPSPALDGRWQRLGYDVADGSFISGLSNCGYNADEALALRAAWSRRLNEHHLFDDPAAAFEFRALSDARVAEHAPFFVYGLYRTEASQ